MRASIGAEGSSYTSFIPFLLKSIQVFLYMSFELLPDLLSVGLLFAEILPE